MMDFLLKLWKALRMPKSLQLRVVRLLEDQFLALRQGLLVYAALDLSSEVPNKWV